MQIFFAWEYSMESHRVKEIRLTLSALFFFCVHTRRSLENFFSVSWFWLIFCVPLLIPSGPRSLLFAPPYLCCTHIFATIDVLRVNCLNWPRPLWLQIWAPLLLLVERRHRRTAHPSHYLLYYYVLLDRDDPDTSLLKGPPPPRSIFISKNTSAEGGRKRSTPWDEGDHIKLLVILR